jgi:hypothetical protein
MAVNFPVTVVIPQIPLDNSVQFKTLISVMDSGKEQRRRRWRFPVRSVSLTYNALTMAQISTLWDFYLDRTGSLGAFNFFEPDVSPYNTTLNSHRDLYVGRGSADTATTYTFPGIALATANTTILVNGTTQTTGYTIGAGTGDGGADLVTFTSNSPPTTHIITAQFTGRLRFNARFADDNMSRLQFEASLFKFGLKIIEDKRTS